MPAVASRPSIAWPITPSLMAGTNVLTLPTLLAIAATGRVLRERLE